MQDFIQQKLPEIVQVLKRHKVRRAYLVESAAMRQMGEDSDVDFLIAFHRLPFGEYAENFWSLEDSLQQLLQRKVDLLVGKTLSNPYLIKSLDQTKVPIYA